MKTIKMIERQHQAWLNGDIDRRLTAKEAIALARHWTREEIHDLLLDDRKPRAARVAAEGFHQAMHMGHKWMGSEITERTYDHMKKLVFMNL